MLLSLRAGQKPFLQRHSKPSQISFGLKYFVSSEEISLQNLISGLLSELKKLSFIVKDYMTSIRSLRQDPS